MLVDEIAGAVSDMLAEPAVGLDSAASHIVPLAIAFCLAALDLRLDFPGGLGVVDPAAAPARPACSSGCKLLLSCRLAQTTCQDGKPGKTLS